MGLNRYRVKGTIGTFISCVLIILIAYLLASYFPLPLDGNLFDKSLPTGFEEGYWRVFWDTVTYFFLVGLVWEIILATLRWICIYDPLEKETSRTEGKNKKQIAEMIMTEERHIAVNYNHLLLHRFLSYLVFKY